MRLKLDRLHNLAGQKRLRAIRNVINAVDGARSGLRVGKFIDIPAGLEAVVLEHRKRRVLRENGDVEDAGFLDHIAGVVRLVDRDADALGGIGLLHDGVDDAAVVFLAVARGEDVKAVRKREHRVLLDRLGLLMDGGRGVIHAVIDRLS